MILHMSLADEGCGLHGRTRAWCKYTETFGEYRYTEYTVMKIGVMRFLAGHLTNKPHTCRPQVMRLVATRDLHFHDEELCLVLF